MERVNAQPGLIDEVVSGLGGPRTTELLERLDKVVPWETLAEPVRKLYHNGEQGGRRPWPAVLMLKCLMLAQWFGLSDPQLEEQLRDRMSFRRFVGLSVDDDTPDETTFVVFRRRLRESKLYDELLARTVACLEERGLLVQGGTLVDATVIEAPRGRKRKDGTSTRDEEAAFTKKNGRTKFGYKGHIAADRSGIVTGYCFSPANHHDSRYIDELTKDETVAVYADSAYMDRKREAGLEERGVKNGIAHRRKRGQKELPPEEQERNRTIAGFRAYVEHPFAWLKRMRTGRARYRGLERNGMDFAIGLIACNFKRSLSLKPRESAIATQ